MTIGSADRTGVLIVRLWTEPGHRDGLRARITRTLDSGAGDESVVVVSTADGVCDVVKQWVEDFTGFTQPEATLPRN